MLAVETREPVSSCASENSSSTRVTKVLVFSWDKVMGPIPWREELQ